MATERPKQNRRVITSFMLRFVYEEEEIAGELTLALPEASTETTGEDEDNPGWRGVVKHIQSGAEHHFTTFAEAEAFIKKYIKE